MSTRPREQITKRELAPTTSGMRRALDFGKYRLFARLGSGGMADVYLAVAQGAMNVNRLVVIKRLRDEHANDQTICEMFLDEARLAARLNHPNVIQTFEAGTETGGYFLAMEYVDGQPLSRVLTKLKREEKTLEPRVAARICADALSGLHYAHELTDFDGSALEIVHRDVSPQNLMVTYEGTVKLVDFGIAKAVGTTQTAHGVFKGKVAFMAPEQVRCEQVDRRADLFSAGIVLWESAAGRLLMAESTPAATLYNLLTRPIPRASSVNPAVPKALDDIIDRALQRDVNERFQTAQEMRDALETFIASEGGVRPEEIGELTKALFSETREKVQSQIKTKLSALSLGRTSESGRHLVEMGQTQIRALENGLEEIDEGLLEGSSAPSSFRMVTDRAAGAAGVTTPRRGAALVWFGVPLIALAASGVALMRSQRSTVALPSTTAVPATVATMGPLATSQPSVAPTGAQAPSGSAHVTPGPTMAARAVSPPSFHARPSAPQPTAAAPAASIATPTTARTSPAPVELSKPAPATPAVAPKPTQEPAQGRTFRRDL